MAGCPKSRPAAHGFTIDGTFAEYAVSDTLVASVTVDINFL